MSEKFVAYLPNDVPPLGQLIILGFQHVLTMFPATVFVALFTGFHVGTVLLAAGISTITALTLSRRGIGKFIPLFYGSSFSYIAAYLPITNATFGQPASDEMISTMQAGIVVTGVLNVVAGLIIRAVGKNVLDRILPPVVTGSVAAVIGFGLGFAALNQASSNWGVALVTLFVTVGFSVYLRGRGFIGMLPILYGAVAGYAVSASLGQVDFTPLQTAALFAMPSITLPSFSGPLAGTAVFSIAVMAIATIPESTAHLYQISLYVDRTAAQLGRERYQLDRHAGFNLILDGIGDFLCGLIGGTAGTNYGENNSLMAITRNYSGPALLAAGVISVLLGFVGILAAALQTVPLAVSGGLAIYLFGVVGMQGVALMIENKVDLFDARELAIGATIFIVGVGGNIGFPNGFLPISILPRIFPNGLPAIATSAVLGILMNALFLIFRPPSAKT